MKTYKFRYLGLPPEDRMLDLVGSPVRFGLNTSTIVQTLECDELAVGDLIDIMRGLGWERAED